MNISVYLFGAFNKGFSQYPNDYAPEFFQSFYKKAKAYTQIAIHRDSDLMYYAYIRKLEQGRYIGLCAVLNGVMLQNPKKLFTLFESIISNLVIKGSLIHFNERGEIVTSVSQLYLNQEEIDQLTLSLQSGIRSMLHGATRLPVINHYKGDDSLQEFSVDDNTLDIVQSSHTNAYTYIYKSKDFNTSQLDSYKSILSRISKERDELKNKNNELNNELTKVKAKQRNFKWVAFLGLIVIGLGVVLWNKVLFPSEVTRYNTGEFVYYGPMKNRKPHGIGVAIYPEDDPQERRFYIGNFANGKRQDDEAMLLYQNGNYFYGQMDGDVWETGVFYKNSTRETFRGEFGTIGGKANCPYNGVWYKEKRKHGMEEGHPHYEEEDWKE